MRALSNLCAAALAARKLMKRWPAGDQKVGKPQRPRGLPAIVRNRSERHRRKAATCETPSASRRGWP